MNLAFSPLRAVLGLSVCAVAVLGQGNRPEPQIKDTPVSGAVHLFEGSGGTIGVSVGADGILMVDDQFANMSAKIETALAALSTNRLAFLLNTHWHGDHTGGNAHFGTKAVIVAQKNVRQRLLDAKDTAASALPVVTHEHGISLHFNGEEIRVIAFGPGHTDGDAAVYFTGSKVLHLGDQFFKDRFPYIDLGSGGDVRGYVKNIADVLAWVPADTKLIPGHGGLATVEDLKNFHTMLVETTSLVESGIKAGKTLAEIRAAGVPEKYKSWGSGFINEARWLEICFNSLGKK
jgi:glyoxylase-like metal-dependent hydrolase (beta-lactamase superfamily II)